MFEIVSLQCQFVLLIKSLPKGEYSSLLIVAAFSSKSFSGKTVLLFKNSYLLKFLDDKAEISTVCLSKLY